MDIKKIHKCLAFFSVVMLLFSCNKQFREAQRSNAYVEPECHSDSLRNELNTIVHKDQDIRSKITQEAMKSNGQSKLLEELKLESVRIDSLSGIQIKMLIEKCPDIFSHSQFPNTLWLVAQHCGQIEERRMYFQPMLKELYSTGRLRKDRYLMFLDRTYTVILLLKNKNVPAWPLMSEVELIEFFEKTIDTESKL